MRLLLLVLPGFLLTACGNNEAETTTVEAPIAAIEINIEPSASYEDAHSAATAVIQMAADKGHAWTTADKLISEAEAAAAGGDESLALKLADDARVQALLAVAQADAEAFAWRSRVISD